MALSHPRLILAILLLIQLFGTNAFAPSSTLHVRQPLVKAEGGTIGSGKESLTTIHSSPSCRLSKTSLSAVAAAASTAPSVASVALACTIPSLVGFYKSEYGVSYAYGGAIAATAWLTLGQLSDWTSLAGMHAMALLFYGIRLNLFLLYRELNIPYFREIRERIESKAASNRLARTPFILSVAFLYGCMSTPILVSASSSFMTSRAFFSTKGCPGTYILRFLVGTTWIGFLLGAIGDLTKTIVKASKGSSALVTEGIFAFLRHPNYTGEWLAWTASALAALVVPKASRVSKLAAVIGAFGIDFVLMQATGALEKRQLEKYGDTEEYRSWVARSWAGFAFNKEEVKEGEQASQKEEEGNSEAPVTGKDSPE